MFGNNLIECQTEEKLRTQLDPSLNTMAIGGQSSPPNISAESTLRLLNQTSNVKLHNKTSPIAIRDQYPYSNSLRKYASLPA